MRKQADLLFQIVSLATLVVALAALGALVYDIFSRRRLAPELVVPRSTSRRATPKTPASITR